MGKHGADPLLPTIFATHVDILGTYSTYPAILATTAVVLERKKGMQEHVFANLLLHTR